MKDETILDQGSENRHMKGSWETSVELESLYPKIPQLVAFLREVQVFNRLQ